MQQRNILVFCGIIFLPDLKQKRFRIGKVRFLLDYNTDISPPIVSNIPDSGSGQIQSSSDRLLSDKAFDAWMVGAINRMHIFFW